MSCLHTRCGDVCCSVFRSAKTQLDAAGVTLVFENSGQILRDDEQLAILEAYWQPLILLRSGETWSFFGMTTVIRNIMLECLITCNWLSINILKHRVFTVTTYLGRLAGLKHQTQLTYMLQIAAR